MAKKGLVFISKTSFTTASTVNVDNVFSANYTHYLVKRNLLGSVAAGQLDVRLRVSGADDSGTNYREQYIIASSTSVTAARVTGATNWDALLGLTEATTFGFAETWISNPFEAVRTTAWCDIPYTQTGNIEMGIYVKAHDLTTSYTGFTVLVSSGTITGSISVFGLVTA